MQLKEKIVMFALVFCALLVLVSGCGVQEISQSRKEYKAGIKAFTYGDYDTAEEHLERVAPRDSKNFKRARLVLEEIQTLRSELQEITLDVINETPYHVSHVYISLSKDNYWSNNLLEAPLPPGGRISFTLDPGKYDIRVADENNITIRTAWGIASSTEMRAGGPDQIRLTVKNYLDQNISYLYFSPTSSNSWGNDRLAEQEIIPPGEQQIFYVPSGVYDLQVRDIDGNVLHTRNNMYIYTEVTWEIRS